jgi:acyl dehydratase
MHWYSPVCPGDTISYRSTVTGKRQLNSRPGWGLVFSLNEGFNQHGELVFSFEGKVMTPQKPNRRGSPI